MKQIQTKAEFTELKSKNQKIILDFHAIWCGPCKFIGPIFEKLASENPSILFVKIDVDKSNELTEFFKVSSMPTFISFLNEEQQRVVKGADENQLRDMVAQL